MDRQSSYHRITRVVREWRLAAAILCISTIAVLVFGGQTGWFGISNSAKAQTTAPVKTEEQNGSRSIGEILNADGTLKHGINGSFDAKELHVMTISTTAFGLTGQAMPSIQL
jgi:hypothetical protein